MLLCQLCVKRTAEQFCDLCATRTCDECCDFCYIQCPFQGFLLCRCCLAFIKFQKKKHIYFDARKQKKTRAKSHEKTEQNSETDDPERSVGSPTASLVDQEAKTSPEQSKEAESSPSGLSTKEAPWYKKTRAQTCGGFIWRE